LIYRLTYIGIETRVQIETKNNKKPS